MPRTTEELAKQKAHFRHRTDHYAHLGYDRIGAASVILEEAGPLDGPVLDVGTGMGMTARVISASDVARIDRAIRSGVMPPVVVIIQGLKTARTTRSPGRGLAAKKTAGVRTQRIRIICGDQDGLFSRAEWMDGVLTKLGIPHEFIAVPGSPHNHDQLLASEAFDSFEFYAEVFWAAASRRAPAP